MSGIGGEVGELDELLSVMLDAQKDLKRAREDEKVERESKEGRKLEVGRALVARAMVRRDSTVSEDDVEEVVDDMRCGKGKGKRRKVVDDVDSELAVLGEAMKETEMARISVDRARLALERERMELEKDDREKERELRREEREARDKLELEKFKLMMKTFASRK